MEEYVAVLTGDSIDPKLCQVMAELTRVQKHGYGVDIFRDPTDIAQRSIQPVAIIGDRPAQLEETVFRYNGSTRSPLFFLVGDKKMRGWTTLRVNKQLEPGDDHVPRIRTLDALSYTPRREHVVKLLQEGRGKEEYAHFYVFHGRWEGGTATVSLALNLKEKRFVALKRPYENLSDLDRDFSLTSMKVEAGILGQLDHPNIVRLHSANLEEESMYLELGFLEGESIKAIAERKTPCNSRLIKRVFSGLVSTVAYYTQQGFRHGDMGPANVMCTQNGDISVFDFGLGSRLGEVHQLSDSDDGEGLMPIGTPFYLPPEYILLWGVPQGVAGEIYGMGMVLREMVAGRPYPKLSTSKEVMKEAVKNGPGKLKAEECPPGLEELVPVINLMTEKDPKNRPTLEELASLEF